MNIRTTRLTGTGLAAAAIAGVLLFAAPGAAHAESKERCDSLLKAAVSDIKTASSYNSAAIEAIGFGDMDATKNSRDQIRFLLDRAQNAIDDYNAAGCGR